jgi:hypothetical protein
MSAADYHELLRKAASRELAPSEQHTLEELFRQHPSVRAEWESDLLIERSLAKLSTPALSTNFTAQVLSAVRNSSLEKRSRLVEWSGLFRSWKWSPAAAALLLAGFLAVQHQRNTVARNEMAQSLASFAEVATLVAQQPVVKERSTPTPDLPPMPDLQVFKDFDAISMLDLIPTVVDMDLLVALQ